MARPMSETTKKIISVLEKDSSITYTQAVDQGLINHKEIDVSRFNVVKHHYKNPKGSKRPKRGRKPGRAPVARTRVLTAVPSGNDFSSALKLISDLGGIKQAEARCLEITKAVETIKSAQDTLAKVVA